MLLVDVDLDELQLALALLGDPVEHGATAWHGPHHSAQKSTSTGFSLWRTSCSKVSVVTFECHSVLPCSLCDDVLVPKRTQHGRLFPTSLESIHGACSRRFPDKPDHAALEREILELWEREETFERLREQNARRPALQLHRRPDHREQRAGRPHRLGPDAEGRLPALQGAARASTSATRTASTARASGSRSRSSRQLGLNSKREIEEYGLAEFAAPLPRASSRESSEAITEQSMRLGQWMDWGNDYFTFSRHEHRVHLALPEGRARARLALHGPPLDRVVPALRHLALAARADQSGVLPGARATRRSTSASRCSTATASRSSSGRRRRGRCPRTSPPRSSPTPSTAGARTASGSPSRAIPDETLRRSVPRARSSSGSRYAGPFDDLAARRRRSSTA